MTRAILLIHYLEIQREMHFRLESESIHFFVCRFTQTNPLETHQCYSRLTSAS